MTGVLRPILAIALLASFCACEATASRPTPRAKLDTKDLQIPLPARGYVVQTSGFGLYDAVAVDLDARTLRVIVHSDVQRDQTLTLEAAQLAKLEKLAERTLREVPHGPLPDAHDILQVLYIVDHDNGFFLSASPIYDVTDGKNTGRPIASEFVLAILALAKPVLDPPPPAAAPIAKAPSTRHKHAIPRKDLATPHTDPKVFPSHGVAVHIWGLGGDQLVVVDQTASTIRTISNLMGEKPSDKTRKLDAKKRDELMTLALDAWHEDATGPTPEATDVREDLIVLDGDEAFYLSGHPIHSFAGDDATGRPAASRAVLALFKATKK